MQQNKRQYNPNREKNEAAEPVKKREEGITARPVRCVSCGKIICEIEEVIAGRLLVKCGHCKKKSALDYSTNHTRTGRLVT